MVPWNSVPEVSVVICSSPWIYQLPPPLFLLHTFKVAPSSPLSLFSALRSEGCVFILSSSKFGTAAIASRSRATTGLGMGMVWAVATQSCSTVPVLDFTALQAPVTQHRATLHWPSGAAPHLAGLLHSNSMVGKCSCSTGAWLSLEVL